MSGYIANTSKEALTFKACVEGAFKGVQQDFTAISLNRAIFFLTVPMVLEMALPALFVLMEIFWMTRFGSSAVAVLGLAESMGSIILAVALGLGVGATALVARRTGEQNADQAARSAVQAILLAVALAIAIGLPFVLFPSQMMAIMGAPEAIKASGAAYAQIYLGGSGIIVLLYVNNAIFRAVGDAPFALRMLWLSILINAAADPVLMFGFGHFHGLGPIGCAIGAIIGRTAGVIVQLFYMLKGTERLRIRWEHLGVQGAVLARLMKISAQAIVQLSVAQISLIGVVRVISLFGVNAIAGYTVAFRIVVVALLPPKGASNVPAVLVGQNLGAAKPDRANRSVWLTGAYNTLLAGLIAAVVLWFSEPILRLFVVQQSTLAIARSGLSILILATVAHAFGLVMLQGFNGAGDAWTPMLVSIFSFLIVQLPAAWLLAVPGGLKSNGAFMSVLIGEMTAAATGAYFFYRGKWKGTFL